MGFLSEKPIKAVRKRHICDGCVKWLEVGEPAVNWCGVVDGEFHSAHYHPDCREAEVALNHLHDWGWNDDWMRLCEADSEDRPWLHAEWPIPYQRMLMTREQYASRKDQPNDR